MGKLVRIEHIKYGEWYGVTYLIAPDHITEKQLQEDVNKALKQYLKIKIDFEELNLPPKYPSNKLEAYPDNMTIMEARRKEYLQKEELSKWQDEKRKASRSFGAYMKDLGYQSLNESDMMLEAAADWDHMHGEILDMDLTELDDTRNKKDWDFGDLV